MMGFEVGLGIATLWQEARGATFDEQCLVAQVIQNRARLRYSSDGTIADTVTRAWQFSGWLDPATIAASLQYVAAGDDLGLSRAWTSQKNPKYDRLVLYYSPKAMAKGSVPQWSRGIVPVLITNNFRFYNA